MTHVESCALQILIPTSMQRGLGLTPTRKDNHLGQPTVTSGGKVMGPSLPEGERRNEYIVIQYKQLFISQHRMLQSC